MQRITSFIRNVADEPSINWSDTNDIYELFRREAHFLLCRQWEDGKYIDANTNSPYFGVMTSGLSGMPSADLRDKVADLFADYVINLSKGE